MIEAQSPCVGCGAEYKTYPSRVSKQRFCSTCCYNQNQSKRSNNHSKPVFSGEKYGRLTVLTSGNTYSEYTCDCGSKKTLQNSLVTKGSIKSCGCWNRLKSRKNGNVTAWNHWFRYLNSASKTRGIGFNLTIDFVMTICVRNCTYCGIEPQIWTGSKNLYIASCANKKTKYPDMLFAESKILYINGIDRIDSNLGYSVDNVQPCCSACNLAKLDRSDECFRKWITRCYQNINTKEVKNENICGNNS